MDTRLSDSLCLKCRRADVAVGTVSVCSVVVDLNVLEDRPACRFSGRESFAMDQLGLHRVEETLSARIVVAVALGAHAA